MQCAVCRELGPSSFCLFEAATWSFYSRLIHPRDQGSMFKAHPHAQKCNRPICWVPLLSFGLGLQITDWERFLGSDESRALYALSNRRL
ncbi:hypothetical protein BJX70DRAFT_273540 [Aspergillus crustosus]